MSLSKYVRFLLERNHSAPFLTRLSDNQLAKMLKKEFPFSAWVHKTPISKFRADYNRGKFGPPTIRSVSYSLQGTPRRRAVPLDDDLELITTKFTCPHCGLCITSKTEPGLYSAVYRHRKVCRDEEEIQNPYAPRSRPRKDSGYHTTSPGI